MCTFSRPCACEYQVLSGSRARMLKKKTGFDRFFLYRLSPEPRPSAPECERHGAGNCARVCVRRAFFVRSGGGVCVLLCVSTSTFVIILRRSLSASSLLPGNKEVQQPPERRALCPGRTVRRSRLHHGFAIDCKKNSIC